MFRQPPDRLATVLQPCVTKSAASLHIMSSKPRGLLLFASCKS
jgi:hypothetical protein